MKRIGCLFNSISSLENLRKADRIAQKGKSKQSGVIWHNQRSEANLLSLQTMLLTKTFTTSAYGKALAKKGIWNTNVQTLHNVS